MISLPVVYILNIEERSGRYAKCATLSFDGNSSIQVFSSNINYPWTAQKARKNAPGASWSAQLRVYFQFPTKLTAFSAAAPLLKLNIIRGLSREGFLYKYYCIESF